MNNILCCNAGRRGRLMIDMRKTIGDSGNVVATDNWSVAPAIFFANKQYVVPKITHPNYIQEVLGICKKEDIKAIFTLIDPEIDLLASNKKKFEEIGVLPLCPSKQTADLCFDKYSMYLYLKNHGVNTPLTFHENPRFGGAYLHAYGAGVDFFKLIINNINGVTNEVRIGDYDEGVLMLMYDDVVITKEVDLLRDYHD
jgi:carbamoyl-phosphate synthase large subunit